MVYVSKFYECVPELYIVLELNIEIMFLFHGSHCYKKWDKPIFFNFAWF